MDHMVGLKSSTKTVNVSDLIIADLFFNSVPVLIWTELYFSYINHEHWDLKCSFSDGLLTLSHLALIYCIILVKPFDPLGRR